MRNTTASTAISAALFASFTFAAFAALAPAAATAPDPLVRYPGNYRVIAENDRVRVLDFRLAKGASEEFHRHPSNVAVFLGKFKIRFTLPDGRTAIRDANTGDVAFSPDPVVHASENIGGTDAHGVLVELKDPPVVDDAGHVTAVTLVHGLPDHATDLRDHLLSLAAPTRAEPGCLRYDLYQSPAQPHEFMRLEVWASMADFERHKQSPHLRASFEKRQREGWTTQILTWQRVPGDRS